MSLTINLIEGDNVVFDTNMTHNLGRMAEYAGLYVCLWYPSLHQQARAKRIIKPVALGLVKMLQNPGFYRSFDDHDGWGTYDDFVRILAELLEHLYRHPNARIEVMK